jgi:dolichyl-phosphate beta-glucosyltransferase
MQPAQPISSPSADQSPELSIVIPAYNEAARLGPALEAIRAHVAQSGLQTELIVIDDGSTDGTGDLVRAFDARALEAAPADVAAAAPNVAAAAPDVAAAPRGGRRCGEDPPNSTSATGGRRYNVTGDATSRRDAAPRPASLCVRLLVNPQNRGKGHSVRRGMLEAAGATFLMCDADLSASLDELGKLTPWLERGFDIVIGSRDMPDSLLDPPQPPLRRWAATAFRELRRRVLLPELRDTQCGFKLFKRAAAREIFSRQTIDGWLFDCEALGIADRMGYRIKEVGILWRNHPDTRVRGLRDSPAALRDLLRIRRTLAHIE